MQKYQAQLRLEDRKAFLAGANESFKAALDYAKVALNTAFLVNGGGAVAMLTFIGNQKAGVSGLAWSIVAFALGALLAAAATGSAFFAQEKVTHSTWAPQVPFVPVWRSATIAFVVLSYFCFCSGAVLAAWKLAGS